MAHQYVLMGDIIRSREYPSPKLREEFMELVAACNRDLKRQIVSPYTVTLGDEFQGIAASLYGVIQAIFHMEETALSKSLDFKMRYVTVYGDIETPVPRTKAHTMMGPGLTQARELLTDLGRGDPRFYFVLGQSFTANQLNRLAFVMDGLTNKWKTTDAALIIDMLKMTNNQEVAKKQGKNRTAVWKRRKHLLIEEYRSLKEAMLEIGQQQPGSL